MRGWRLGWRRGCALTAVGLALLTAGDAQAAEPTASDRERARSLLLEGREKLDAGDAAAAVKAFEAAHAIMGVPTTGLDLARGLAAMGRLIEARTTALDVVRTAPVPREPRAFTNARKEAETLAEALARRIPSLVIEVSGPPEGKASVTVDGAAVPAQALGLSWKVDPGEHVVVAKAPGFGEASQSVAVDEGSSSPVKLVLQAGEGDEGGAGEGGGIPAWAWVSGGVGLAALGVSIGFAVDYAAVRSQVEEDCPDQVCDLRRYDDAAAAGLGSRWNRDLGLTVGFGVAAAAGLGLAVYGIASASGAPSEPEVAVSPWFGRGAGGLTVGGTF
ncbi:hypothetical protein [Chondromyces apiculatus]|uniref:PEGA domain-containing protein n=1 Tax=Chondromyces apiculatus DSM 436 TaxID=1192034 RepID=A0A017TIB2_9BACT|nr:hypothetical protein [Chondromyces apiculatus]EYF08555.1 Hypothetical protein CAP_4085 [Chondromyces apiculatus DSM 436]